ncbi:unnamed protein product [Adineta ricciae]|uniref:Nanos-type domain-containing protein n=1 Tax=Adineta ricciae TaxID=249248 RepID=A0A813VP19_ADIRI|nr:unnamed protein product [Adineta ricciae]
METALGRGYSINDESGLTDFYSPPSSIVDEDEEQDDDLFYPEDVEPVDETIFASSSANEATDTNSKSGFNSLPLKLMSIEATPPPTPLVPRRFFDPINATTTAFQNLSFNTNVSIAPSKNTDLTNSNWSLTASSSSSSTKTTNSLFPYAADQTPKTPTKTTSLLTPTSMDRYLLEHRPHTDSIYQSTMIGTTANRHHPLSAQHTEVKNETSRLFSYMTSVDGLTVGASAASNQWSTYDDKPMTRLDNSSYTAQFHLKSPQRGNPLFSSSTSPPYQYQEPWFLSEMSTILRQNTNISLSSTAQQILAANTSNNNRPLRSEKIDIEVIKHLIQEADWKRQCGMKKEVCVFCRNNGENELIYSSHSLKDSMGNVTCPILRAYQCPICGATGPQAHTIKYCQATGDDNNRHVPTPYEKMLRMQTFGYDDNMTPSISAFFGHLDSPSSLYTNGWSDSYL